MVIFDLDNCLADDQWRLPYIDWSQQNVDLRYQNYHSLCGFDRCAGLTDEDRKMLIRHEGYVVFTSRPSWTRAITVEWLARARLPAPVEICMRQQGDYSPCAELKGRMLVRLIGKLGIPAYAWYGFDDQPAVIEAYRALGAEGKVRAIHSGQPIII